MEIFPFFYFKKICRDEKYMKKNPFKWPLSACCGVGVIFFEMTFIFAAFLLWPSSSGTFSIFTNYYSELGVSAPGYNSFLGARFFNMSQGIQGTFIIMFFGGLHVFIKEDDKSSIKLTLGQIFGIITGIAWVMVGVYSVELGLWHDLVATIYFLAFIPAMILISIEIIKNSEYNNKIGYYGLIAALIDILFVLFVGGIDDEAFLPFIIFMEFAMVWSSELWVFLIALNVLKVED